MRDLAKSTAYLVYCCVFEFTFSHNIGFDDIFLVILSVDVCLLASLFHVLYSFAIYHHPNVDASRMCLFLFPKSQIIPTFIVLLRQKDPSFIDREVIFIGIPYRFMWPNVPISQQLCSFLPLCNVVWSEILAFWLSSCLIAIRNEQPMDSVVTNFLNI